MVWYTLHGKQKHNKTHLKHLFSIQYQAAQAITRVYRAILSQGLEIKTYILPITQKFDYFTVKAALVSPPTFLI